MNSYKITIRDTTVTSPILSMFLVVLINAENEYDALTKIISKNSNKFRKNEYKTISCELVSAENKEKSEESEVKSKREPDEPEVEVLPSELTENQLLSVFNTVPVRTKSGRYTSKMLSQDRKILLLRLVAHISFKTRSNIVDIGSWSEAAELLKDCPYVTQFRGMVMNGKKFSALMSTFGWRLGELNQALAHYDQFSIL